MRKWFIVLIMGAFFVLPTSAIAQAPVTIASADINLWPEYDKADMLVINYILLTPETPLPASLVIRLPLEAATPLVIAVGPSADQVTDQNVKFSTRNDGKWLVVSIIATGPAVQLEYYDPGLKRVGNSRSYSYEWVSDYEVKNLSLKVQQPIDATDLKTTPALVDDGIHQDQLRYYVSKPVSVPAGKVITLELNYQKPSDALSISRLQLQPVRVDENTPGRVSFTNSLPYVVGGLGVVMILGGLVYYWGAGRNSRRKTRRRAHSIGENKVDGVEIYCPQCGERAKPGDRFCRVCGGRLRVQEE
jgi:hypothetical protein